MNERRRFLHILGAGAAAVALPACSGAVSSDPSASGAGASGETSGTGGGSGSTGSGGSGGSGGAGGATSSSTGTGGGGGGAPCEQSPPGVAVGMPAEFQTAGLHKLPGTGMLMGRDANGLYVLSSICTHQSCDMDQQIGGQNVGTITSNGIDCNCHGSRFDNQGNVVKGPASKPLKAYALALGCDGNLYANKSHVVPSSTRLVS
jgi:Rieske Fe-S protein